jgi:hypothetical protein
MLETDFTLTPPQELEAARSEAPPAQGMLFAPYLDRQRKKAARYVEPSLMDYLADNPRGA